MSKLVSLEDLKLLEQQEENLKFKEARQKWVSGLSEPNPPPLQYGPFLLFVDKFDVLRVEKERRRHFGYEIAFSDGEIYERDPHQTLVKELGIRFCAEYLLFDNSLLEATVVIGVRMPESVMTSVSRVHVDFNSHPAVATLMELLHRHTQAFLKEIQFSCHKSSYNDHLAIPENALAKMNREFQVFLNHFAK